MRAPTLFAVLFAFALGVVATLSMPRVPDSAAERSATVQGAAPTGFGLAPAADDGVATDSPAVVTTTHGTTLTIIGNDPPPTVAHTAPGPVAIQLRVDQWVLPTTATRGHLLVQLDGRVVENPPPVAVALVIDVSGSMRGQKLEDARAAAMRVVDSLRPGDRLTVVAYDDSARVLVRDEDMQYGRQLAVSALQGLRAGGNTCMSCGMDAGVAHLAAHAVTRPVRMLVLGDGLANRGQSETWALESLARRARAQGILTTTVGVGRDYDERLMDLVAQAGQGNYYHVGHSNQIARVIDREVQSLLSVAATDIVVTVRSSGGSQIRLELPADGALRVGQLGGGERRQWVVPFTIGDGVGGVDLAATLEYRTDGILQRSSAQLGVIRSADLAQQARSRDNEVHERVVVEANAMQLAAATSRFEAGDFEAADRSLREAESTLADVVATTGSAAAQRELDQVRELRSAASAPAMRQDADARRGLRMQNVARAREYGSGGAIGSTYHSVTE